GEDVARDLLADELVVRLVFVERFDDIVAVTISRSHWIIRIVSGRVRVTRDIEPMPSPFFAVSLRPEQTINDLLEGASRGVPQKRLNLFRRRRQPGQIESRAANQRAFIGVGDRLQTFLFELGQDETIYRRFDPGLVFDFGRLMIFDRLKRPELSSFL